MLKKLTQTDLQRLFELAYTHGQAHNWDDAMEAELEVEQILEGCEDLFPIWRDLSDHLDVFYRANERGMIFEEAAAWLANEGMAEIMLDLDEQL